MTKTIVVRVERRFPHPQFKKVVTGYKKFYAHDEKAEAKVGDRVRIEETRPLSKIKRWRLVEVVERSADVNRGGGLIQEFYVANSFHLDVADNTGAKSRLEHRRAGPQPALCRHRRHHQGPHQGSRAGWHGEKGRGA